MSPELQAAIENLYVAFGDVPKPLVIEGCPCCIGREGVDVLLNKPLRAITPDELSNYAACAFNTVGSLPDYLYLIPRILEILVIDSGWYPDVEIVAVKLKRIDFQTWPDAHRMAIDRYFDTTFDELITSNDDGWQINSWICALGFLYPDISSYLNRLARHSNKVIEVYEINSQSLIKGRLSNSFWDENLPAYHQVLAWFESPTMKIMIKDSYGLYADI